MQARRTWKDFCALWLEEVSSGHVQQHLVFLASGPFRVFCAHVGHATEGNGSILEPYGVLATWQLSDERAADGAPTA
jgi:hypothetical protein